MDLYFTSSVSGNVADPANALGAPDNVWTTDTGNTNWTHRWRLGSPGGNYIATGTQTLVLRVRRDSTGGTDPTINSVTLIQGANSTVIRSTSYVPGNGDDLTITFDSSILNGLENVDIELATSGGGGSPANRRSVQVDGATWQANLTLIESTMINTWNGTAWVQGSLKKYNGTTWVGVILKRWNGTAWENA